MARTITFPAGATQTVTRKLTLKGSVTNQLNVVSDTPGTKATLDNTSALTESVYEAETDIAMLNRGAACELSLAANTQYALRGRVKGASGSIRIALWDDAGGKQPGASLTLDGAEHDLKAVKTTTIGATQYAVIVETDSDQHVAFNVDSVQVEAGGWSSPFVQSSRGSARVYDNDPLALREDVLSVVFRIAYGLNHDDPALDMYLFDWRAGASDLISLYMDRSTNRWTTARLAAGVGAAAQSAPQNAYLEDDRATVAAVLDATHAKVSVNGAAAVSAANAAVPNLDAAVLDFGSSGGALHAKSRVLWAAFFSNALSDAQLAALAALPDAPPTIGDLPGSPIGVWNPASFSLTVDDSGLLAADAYPDPASTLGSGEPLDWDISAFATAFQPYAVPSGVDLFYKARLPFAEAQAALAGIPQRAARRLAVVGYHGTNVDPEKGSFAIAKIGGAFEDLIGHVVKITTVGASPERSVYAFVHSMADIAQDMSCTRRLYQRFGLLGDVQMQAVVELADGS